jgi:murein DD-endopeptidase MepM/ murein hydrolase activator NlpD
VYYGIIFLFFATCMTVAGFYLRGKYFENTTHILSYSLEETIETFEDYRQNAQDTHIYLRENTLEAFNQLSNEQARAQAEFERQQDEHRNNFENTLSYIESLEQQLADFETERLELMDFLTKRATQIPPIANELRQLVASQEILFEELTYNTAPAPAPPATVGLMSLAYQQVTESEFLTRIDVLLHELQIQRRLIESIEAYSSRMGTYLKNYPTLMPIDGGVITSGFGSRRDPITGISAMHYGVDIPAPGGTPIKASGGGIVVFSGWRSGYGNVIYIDHGNDIETRYAHNSSNSVSEGEQVARGQIIGYVGSTGRSISMHLHYEVLKNGQFTNPVPFITENN